MEAVTLTLTTCVDFSASPRPGRSWALSGASHARGYHDGNPVAALRNHPDRLFTSIIVEGLCLGFRDWIGFDRLSPLQSVGRRLPCHRMSTRNFGRVASSAPSSQPGQPEYTSVALERVPKGHASGKWRVITDLDPSLCLLSYISVDSVASIVAQLGRRSLLAKIDIESAYHLVPVHPDDRHLLGIQWMGNVYCDGRLPFGLRSSAKLFNAVADALEWIIRERGVHHITHYLDDFVVLGGPASSECADSLATMTRACADLSVPLAEEKSNGPASVITFLGILVDTIKGSISLPPPKLERLHQELHTWGDRKSCTRKELESIIGLLNHACKVVRPGRSFLHRMIDLLLASRSSFAPKSHHRIRLSRGFRSDLEWWRSFLAVWNGVGFFPSASWPSVCFSFNASGSWGCAAHWGNHWFQLKWDGPSLALPIAVKELILIILATAVWGPVWRGETFKCLCDNQAV